MSEAGAGLRNGLSLANAWNAADVLNSANWSPVLGTAGKISPGDRLIINGTNTTMMEPQQSGTAGHPITLFFATGAKFSNTSWTVGAGIHVKNCNYITIDGNSSGKIGGVGGDSARANGIIECTANGSNRANQLNGGGIWAENASNLTVKNMWIRQIFTRTQGAAKTANETSTGGIGCYAVNDSYSNLTVQNCIVSDAYIGIDTAYGNPSQAANFLFQSITISNCNWGLHIGGNTDDAKIDNVECTDCIFGNYAVWDDPAGDYHHNGLFFVPSNSAVTGYQHGVRIHHNIFNDNYGLHSTSAMDLNSPNSDWDLAIYENLFFCPNDVPTNELITLAIHSGTATVANNSVYAAPGSGSALITISGLFGLTSNKIYNVYNNAAFNMALMYFHDDNAFTVLNEDYNVVSGTTFSGFYYQYESNGKTLAQWQALGYDPHGSNADPKYVSAVDLHLQAGSPCDVVAISQAAIFTVDFDGVPWVATRIGAYKYGGIPPPPPPITRTGKVRLTGLCSTH